MARILELLQLEPSLQSADYVENKTQFHLFNLLTEQRHRSTWNLSFVIQNNIRSGLEMLLAVDQDVSRKLSTLATATADLEQAAQAIVEAIAGGHKIYVYGCGATGRLAKQMESSFWRPFWRQVRQLPCWQNLNGRLPSDIEDRLIGEMTGADRALVSSLEGFEDLQLIGRLQLQDHGVQRGDVVICVTEGGETSSVIGTVLGALEHYGAGDPATLAEARRRLYFVYNNPDEVLRPFQRSVSVLDNPGITKMNLATGPQSITGSTRLQATTSETFVVGVILEEAIGRMLRRHLNPADLEALGFPADRTLASRLGDFFAVKRAVDDALVSLARFTALETETYRRQRFATYFAKRALITVFIDNTERSPTFRLYPLDRVQDRSRQCWVQVWTEARDARESWINFLGRPFRGLDPAIYKRPFEEQVDDPFLREAALRSLANAGNDQASAYDFSFSPANLERREPCPGDLAVAVLIDDEMQELARPDSSFRRFIETCRQRENRLALIIAAGARPAAELAAARELLRPDDALVELRLADTPDPLLLRRHIALKMLLNAHSTGVMAALGRVIGNTMTNVSPSNLKLIGRATFLILSHVNDTLRQPEWIEKNDGIGEITFAEANAVLLDAIDWVKAREFGQTAEVALSIIRILEALRRSGPVDWIEAQAILDGEGLASYLARHNPALRSCEELELNREGRTAR